MKGFADVALNNDPDSRLLTLKATSDPRFGISMADLS